MKKLLLACTIVANAGSLYGMEVQKESESPIKLREIYYHFAYDSDLLPEIAQQIFVKLFEAQGIDPEIFMKLCEAQAHGIDHVQLDMNNLSVATRYLTKLLNVCGYDFAVEIAKALFNQRQMSICDIKDSFNFTLLHEAACGKIMMIKLLIEISDDNIGKLLFTKTTDRYANTALHLAIEYEQVEIVKLLLKAAGNDVKALLKCQDGSGTTPLSLAQKQLNAISPMSSKGLIIMNCCHHHPAILKLVTDAYAACNKDKHEEVPKEEATGSCILQ